LRPPQGQRGGPTAGRQCARTPDHPHGPPG
jgi:hypothetical protein